ncbi:MAG: hypothetical protein M3O71_03695 [Bacteroidota bacterium]|nr:hypothetical protein [Bacteroidota bacterium]
MNLEFEGNGIYLNEEDYYQSISKNGLWVEMDKESTKLPGVRQCNRQYVLMEGTFDAVNQGHMGAFSGAIKDIKRLEAWSRVFVTSPNPKKDKVSFPPPPPPPSAADKQ